ncbi:MAG: hypothetical protein HETSPECPRED_002351, partial [Heterodermia speciosa]
MTDQLISKAPTPPDFHFCHPFYNYEVDRYGPLLMRDCLDAEDLMEGGDAPTLYYLSNEVLGDEPGITLPVEYHV